jgi:uncharacterized protein (DUF1800 family)
MASLRGLVIFALGFGLGLPGLAQQAKTEHAPSQTQPANESEPLSGDERILHALNRFTFGPKPGDLEAVRQMGLEDWFNEQLQPGDIDESDLSEQLNQYPAIQFSTQDLLHRLPSNALVHMAAEGKASIPTRGDLGAIYRNQIARTQSKSFAPPENLAANTATPTGESIEAFLKLSTGERLNRLEAMPPQDFDDFLKALKPAQRVQLTVGMSPGQKETLAALDSPARQVSDELLATRLTHDIYANAQLQEVMTDFWLNHFNVYMSKSEQMPYYLASYERDTIRPLALGRFEDLLEAVAHSPVMLIYLDNTQSMGPDSPAAKPTGNAAARKTQAGAGLNENYARELLEMHTLGSSSSFTQADVTQVACILSGWTVDHTQTGGGFFFFTTRHQPGTKVVLGQSFEENGEMEGRTLLHFLAMRPETAHFLARKLAIRFVSDDPPQALVDRLAGSYLESGGEMRAVLKTLFDSPEFWAKSNYHAKVKTPLELVVSAARTSNAAIENMQPLVRTLREMGMPLYGAVSPAGYSWDAAHWVNTGGLVSRMNFALALASNQLQGITVVWAPELDINPLDSDAPLKQVVPTPESEETRLEPLVVESGVSDSTRKAILEQLPGHSGKKLVPTVAWRPDKAPSADKFEQEDELLSGLLMGSPEFQRR